MSHKQSESENQSETEDIENVSSTSDGEDMSSVVEDTIEAHSSAKQTEPSNQKDPVRVKHKSQLSLKSNQERMLQNQQMNLANQKLLLENRLNLSNPTTSSKDSTQDLQNESKNICFIRATKSMADILTNNLIEDIFVAEETDGKLTMRCKACDQYNAKYTSKYTKIGIIIKDLQ